MNKPHSMVGRIIKTITASPDGYNPPPERYEEPPQPPPPPPTDHSSNAEAVMGQRSIAGLERRMKKLEEEVASIAHALGRTGPS